MADNKPPKAGDKVIVEVGEGKSVPLAFLKAMDRVIPVPEGFANAAPEYFSNDGRSLIMPAGTYEGTWRYIEGARGSESLEAVFILTRKPLILVGAMFKTNFAKFTQGEDGIYRF